MQSWRRNGLAAFCPVLSSVTSYQTIGPIKVRIEAGDVFFFAFHTTKEAHDSLAFTSKKSNFADKPNIRMDNYIVSARKYRPQTFDSVVGQKALTTTLKNAISSGKLAHAYLFCGPRGVGKTTCARIFAKTINCLQPLSNGEACNECESCKAFNEGRSMNIFELDAASNNSVDDIRQIIEQVNTPPQVGVYKVFIIDEVHMLSAAAFNAFLKTLEEPPAHVIFILATTEKHKVLPTILSRCQIYDFNRMEIADIVSHLKNVAEKEDIKTDDEALNVIAQKADGGMRDALSIFDQVASFSEGDITYQKVIEDLNVLDYDYYFKVTDQLLAGNVTEVMLTFNDILRKGFSANNFMGGLASHFRNLLVSKDAATLPLLEVAESVRQRYAEQAKKCDTKFLYRALKLCNNCDINYRTSRNKRLTVEITLIEVAQLNSDDVPSSGLGPTKILKPIFKAVAVQKQAQTSPATIAAEQTDAAKTAETANNSTKQSENPTTTQQPSTFAKKPLQRTVSLRQVLKSSSTQATRQESETVPKHTYGLEPYTESDMQSAWVSFAQRLPIEETAQQGRMKMMVPKLLADNVIDVPVENDMVMSDYKRLQPAIEDYIRKFVHNDKVHLALRLLPPDKQNRPISRREQFEALLKKSPALNDLCKELGLELA